MKVKTLAFEGPNRSGKGLQIGFLQKHLAALDIPTLVVRGDGSRTADGEPGNPKSEWWDIINRDLRNSGPEIWHLAAEKLASEMVYWRKEFLPEQIVSAGKDAGYLLVDRSLLSRAMLCLECGVRRLVMDDLYPLSCGENGTRDFEFDDICPDCIFLFSASRETLLSRLEQDDSKYHFRKQLIERKWDWYDKYLEYCPLEAVERVVRIDAAQSPEKIHEFIVDFL